ncbi:flavanone 3-dioxygenase 2-like [Silene latifolia]|uniref:flavanone 3-dioxygenase 2-like n=1 Tax=Silene latifolia TaxID=37657 RepID=UPI003D7835E1
MENALTTTKNFYELPNDQLRRAAEHYGAYSSSFVHREGHHKTAKYWRDTLPFYLPSGTIDYDDTAFLFNFRVGFFASLVKGVAENLVSCISEGLGLGKTYFDDQGLTTVRRLNLNSYPRCPCPNLTCGMAKHYDPDLLTITLEGGAHGLQILDENNQWQTVKAQPNALIVTIGTQMEVVSNGILKAPAHRVIVNDQRERTSICYAIAPANTSTVGPAVTGLPGARPAQYKNNYPYGEYLEQHMTNYRDTSVCFSKFKL